jgi:flavodoxin
MENTLVAYFSAGGTTATIAEKLAKAIGADLFEIKPKVLYTSADLDWNNPKSRSSLEMADLETRPEIMFKNKNMDKYGLVFVGFPIWWYREPSIIDTFIEQYDFSGKTIVPFATSGSSDIGKAPDNIQKLAPEAKVKPGRRFPKDVTEHELAMWAEAFR